MTEKERIERNINLLEENIADMRDKTKYIQHCIDELRNNVKELNNDGSTWKPQGDWHFNINFDHVFKDSSRHKYYNCFDTEEEALKISKKINAWLKLYHITKHLNEDWEPDWNARDEHKYYIYYNNASKRFVTGYYNIVQSFNDIYFKSEDLAEKALELMGDDINYLFDKGVKKC